MIEPHRPRDFLLLDGVVGAPLAVAPTGDAVYVTDENELGMASADGHVRWTLLVGRVPGAPALDQEGTCYVASRDGALYAIGPSGEQRWERALGGSPRGGAALGPGRIAVALEQGALAWWRRSDGSPTGRVLLGARPSAGPVLASDERAIVSTLDGQLVSATATAVLWRARLSDAAAVGPAAVGPDGAVYAGTADGRLGAVEAHGELRWLLDAGGPIERSPVLSEDGGIYAAAGDAVLAISQAGAPRWRRPVGGRVVGGPLVADDGTIFVSVREPRGRGAALGLDAQGRVAIRLPLPAPPAPSLSLARHRLWVGLQDGTVRRISVAQEGIARSSWAKARGDLRNSGFARR